MKNNESKVKTVEEIQSISDKIFKMNQSMNPSGSPKDWCDTSFKEGYRISQSHITKLEAENRELREVVKFSLESDLLEPYHLIKKIAEQALKLK